MKSYEQLAQAAHQAYSKKLRQEAGVGCPAYETLPKAERDAWISATKQIVAEAALVH